MEVEPALTVWAQLGTFTVVLVGAIVGAARFIIVAFNRHEDKDQERYVETVARLTALETTVKDFLGKANGSGGWRY